MSIKSKIITVIICILVEFGLLFGSYTLGRHAKYKGTTVVGETTLNSIIDLKTDVTNATNGVDLSINLLNPVVSSSALSIQTINYLKDNNKKKDIVIEGLINRFNETTKSLEDFEKSYKGSNEDYAWDLAIKEAEELEQLLDDYEKLIKTYNEEKLGD